MAQTFEQYLNHKLAQQEIKPDERYHALLVFEAQCAFCANHCHTMMCAAGVDRGDYRNGSIVTCSNLDRTDGAERGEYLA